MYVTRQASDRSADLAAPGPWLLRRLIAHLARGRLTVTLPSGEMLEHTGALPGPHARLDIHNRRALTRILGRGDIGFAEGFVAGDWSSPDLTALIALAAENVAALDRKLEGIWLVRMTRLLAHALKRNTPGGSKRNIAFHYDLGNDFYRLWLDRSMTYSSACAILPGQSLEDAQAARLDRIAALLRLDSDSRVLEIGCGWGALAMRLAREGAEVTGLTLSREQLGHARAQIAEQDLDTRIDLRLQDYRDEQGSYDRIVSIEMIEAVGEEWWPTYFGQLQACLKPGGRVVLQAITIREDRYAAYKRNPDFIQRYIFPGGMLPTPAILYAQAENAGLRVTQAETFASGYAQTLAQWRHRFLAARDEVTTMGFDERFCRLWEYYLSYCEAGFRTGTIDVGLYVLEHAA